MKITENDWGELLCRYRDCIFCANEKCHGGLYQCPHIVERAKALLPGVIEYYEEGKAKNYNAEYLAVYKSSINTYKRIIAEYEN